MGKPYVAHGVMVGTGAATDPKTLTPGTTGQVLTATTGADPAFAAPATVSLTTGVSGILPVANGGTGQAVGGVAIMQFWGVTVAANVTVYLGRADDATELNVRFRSPVAGTVLRMYTQASVAASVGQTFTYTLVVAGTDSALTHQITGAGNGGREGSSTGTIAVVAGNFISVKLVTSATAAVASHMASIAMRVDG